MPWKQLRWWLLSGLWGGFALVLVANGEWRETPRFLVGMDICLLMVLVERAILKRKRTDKWWTR